MQLRMIVPVLVLAPVLALAGATAAHATTLTGSLSTWLANVPASYDKTTNTGLALFSTVASVPLADGATLTLSGSSDTLLRPLSGWGPWSGGYTGDIVDSTTNSETISFSNLSAFGLQLSPDLSLNGANPETFTVSLSDGTKATLSGNYPTGTTQFVGFYGAKGITSITISATNAPDFAFGNFVDVRASSAVPEPASLGLLAMALAALAGLRRRTRKPA